MKIIFLSGILLAIGGGVLLAKDMLTAPYTEPAIMFLFGTGLVGIAGILRKKTVKR